MHFWIIRASRLPVYALLLASFSAPAQRLALSRGDDNFEKLSHDSLHRAIQFPGIKALYLDQNKRYFIGFGGEVRQQLQMFSGENWGELHVDNQVNTQATTNDRIPFLLQRYMLNVNLQLGSHVRFFSELKSAVEQGRRTGARPQIDEDQLDVHQLFIDVTANAAAKTKFTLRAGRQELNYGASRVISLNEGPNTRLAFQGAKLMVTNPSFFVHLFYTNPVANNQGVFDDRRETGITLWGGYANWQLPGLAQSALDLYALSYQNHEAIYANEDGREDRYTAGFRWFRLPGSTVDVELEANYQTGTFNNGTIRAYSVVGIVGHEFEEATWQPSIKLIGSLYSGDQDNGHSLGTFNPLFPRVYLGLGVPLFPSNLINISPVAEIHPAKRFSLIGDVHALWRQSTSDGLYGEGRLIRQPYLIGTKTNSQQSFIGLQYDLTAEYNFTNYFGLSFYGTLFPAGTYLRDSGASQTIAWSLVQAKWRF